MQSRVGKRIEELRKKAGFTLKDFGNELGVQVSYAHEIEKKIGCPSGKNLRKIADALGTTVEYLLAGEDVSETSASDAAFFRKYKKMDKKGKEKLRLMCEIL